MLGVIGQAVVLFVATNVDDLIVLALLFGRAAGQPGAARRVVVGQYLGFLGILAASLIGVAGASLLPDDAVPYLGLVPIAIGLREGWAAWSARRTGAGDDGGGEADEVDAAIARRGLSVPAVAGLTFANGGDNIALYVPVLAAAEAGEVGIYAAVFLALVGVWCVVAMRIAARPSVARGLERWGDVLLPIVLIALGLAILVEGGVLGG